MPENDYVLSYSRKTAQCSVFITETFIFSIPIKAGNGHTAIIVCLFNSFQIFYLA